MSYNFLDLQQVKRLISYLAGSKTKPTIRSIMTHFLTGMIASPRVSATELGTFLMFDNGILVGILAITSSTVTRTTMTTS
jgi:hypothetical protein